MNLQSFWLTAFLVLTTLPGQAQWYESGKAAPDNEWRQQQAGFGVMLAVSPDPHAFVQEWYSTNESHVPHLNEPDHVKRGDTVGALVFFSGCAAEGEKCDALVDFKVLAPDGKVYGEYTGNLLWAQTLGKPTVVALSQANLVVRIEQKDQLGRYTVLVDVRSPSSKRVFHLKKSFVVEP